MVVQIVEALIITVEAQIVMTQTLEAQTANMQVVKVSVSTPLPNTIPNDKEPHHLKTHSWWVRDYEILFGMSEVNAFLLWNKFKPAHSLSMAQFRLQLCHQMLMDRRRERSCLLKSDTM